jgi:hypothetical protein
MVIDGRMDTKRSNAGERLREVLTSRLMATPPETTTEPQPIAHLAGLDILGQTTTIIENDLRLLVPEAEIELRFVEHEWRNLDPTQLVQRLERRIHRFPDTVERFRSEATEATKEAERAEAQLGQPWEHTEELSHLRRRQQELNEALDADTPANDAPAVDLIDDGVTIVRSDASSDAMTQLRERLDRPRSPSPADGLSL